MAERCFRTAFISTMLAPLESRLLLTACLSAKRHPVGRQHHQRRTAARHQGDDQIIRGQSLHGGKDLASGLLAHRVGRWMRGFQHLDPARGRTLAVARDHDAAEIDVAPGGVERRRHRHRGLAGPDHHATTFWFLRQMPQHCRTGIGVGDRRVEHPSQQAACRSVGPAGKSSSAQTLELWIASTTALVTSFVVAVPPTSGVMIPAAQTFSTARISRAEASGSPR